MTSLTDRNAAGVRDEVAGKPKLIPPLLQNQMRLYSYFKPGLEAGNYHIEAEQKIRSLSYDAKASHDAKAEVWAAATKRVFNKDPKATGPEASQPVIAQDFEVMAPQFSLERAMINSYYPPDGHQDEGRILPHLVLNDPHFPWERDAGTWEAPGAVNHESIGSMKDPDLDADGAPVTPIKHRSKVPWIALLVFDPAELRLSTAEANCLSIPDFSGAKAKDIAEAPASGAFSMQVSEYLSMPVANRINFDVGLSEEPDGLAELKAKTDMMQAIFPTKTTFKSLFPDAASLEANKYLAHVRTVNTIGFPDAGTEMIGNYSILISARTANLNITEPTTQICHLVSIEHVDSTIQSAPYSTLSDDGRIGMISLFSWTYTALPPNPINFVDSIEHVVEGMQMLRAPEALLRSLREQVASPITSDVTQQKSVAGLYHRLSAGYTLSRWRCESGEETAAFNRGPLVPEKLTGPPVADWAAGSNNSKEYQILDRTTGLMDLSYSSAWQLGKTLAIADTVFNSALMRFRSLVYSWAVDKARLQKDNIKSTSVLAASLTHDLRVLGDLAAGKTPDPQRVVPPTRKDLKPNSVEDPKLRPVIAAKISEAVTTQASDAAGEIWKQWSLDKPKNSDWPIISQWISDKLSLVDIPAHYLIPDPSYLPDESLRFFHIDDTWMDCLIDGALSVANHLDPDDDLVRTYIKQVYNRYLDSEVLKPDGTSSGLKPQIPCYGFILRSQILKVMPDIRITVEWWRPVDESADADKRGDVCRYTKLDDITLLALLDRRPEELKSIVLAQPPHQQRFSLGYALYPDRDPLKSQLLFRFRQLYTTGAPADKGWPLLHGDRQPDSGRHEEWYDWNSRVVKVARLAKDINKALRLETSSYQDYVPTSAELAMELNDPSYFFSILPRLKGYAARIKVPRNRKLFTREASWKSIPAPVGDDKSSSMPLGILEPKGLPQAGDMKTNVGDSPSKSGGSNGVVFTKKPLVLPPNPSQPIARTSLMSCFTIDVFADYKGYPKKWNLQRPEDDGRPDEDNYLPTGNDYLYDLIFSVRKFRKGADQTLVEILIHIPHTGSPKDVEPLLESNYADPRARMLSNQRFVVFLNNTTTHLQVRIVPRSATMFPSGDKQVPATMSIKDSRSDDLSFRLAECPIPKVTNPIGLPVHGRREKRMSGSVQIKMLERYVVDGGLIYNVPGSVGVPYFVAKLDVKDTNM